MENSITELFEQSVIYPDIDYQDRLNLLVGLDEQKVRLTKVISLLVHPEGISKWGERHHPDAKKIIDRVLRRPPLVILAGDVGSGKSELALTIGDAVARQEKIEVSLLPLSLSARGEGRVGEMTKLISSAFSHTISQAEKLKKSSGGSRGAVILLIDEADALAQSRESGQMHHEDKAGVNAFIRGIDSISNKKLAVAVIMCTNRLGSLDPAIKRRAADILSFARPNAEQRFAVLYEPLAELGFSEKQIQQLVTETGPKKGSQFGFTFSDLTQRLIPAIVLDAYPNNAVEWNAALRVAKTVIPTPPFNEKKS
jgi:AAA+ superfamily predicted ATPase